MESASKRFFNPYVGKEYTKGINGKRVLVIGASFYCPKHDCIHFKECTNSETKDSSPFNAICPPYNKNPKEKYELADEPKFTIEDHEQYKAYKNFTKCINRIENMDGDAWDRLAFTNYVQFFVPTVYTYKSYLSERDLEAFFETIKILRPNVVVLWGTVINEALQDKRYLVEESTNAESYIWHLRIPDEEDIITLVNCYHPSSSSWHQDIDGFTDILKRALEIE